MTRRDAGKRKGDRRVKPRFRDELRAVLDGMLEGVIAVDGDQRVIHVNAGARLLIRGTTENVVGMSLRKLVDEPAVREPVERVLAGGEAEDTLVRRRRGLRDEVIRVRTAPLSGKRGRLAGAVVVLEDISELERLATVRQEFISNASHELKTPVTAILGLIETLVDAPDIEPEMHQSFLLRIRDQARRLRALVGDLLTLSRLDAPDAPLVLERMNLAEPVREAFEALAPVALTKSIALRGAWPKASLMVKANREGLRQAASNLIENALKYTLPGGRVEVRVIATSDGDHPLAQLEVEDTGIGIAQADQERVFERFFRVDRARSRDAGGTGLGLAIVKHIARATGGTISLTSTPGRGSCFRVAWSRI